MGRLAVLLLAPIIAAACTSAGDPGGAEVTDAQRVPSVDTSASGAPGSVRTTDPTLPTDTTPDDTAPNDTAPNDTAPNDTGTPPLTTFTGSDGPGPQASTRDEPTSGVTVVRAGSDERDTWTAFAIWDGARWQQPYNLDDAAEVSIPTPSFDSVSVASLGLPSPVTGLAYGGEAPDCLGHFTSQRLDLGVPIGDIAIDSGYKAVAVAGDWDLDPRPVELVGLDAPAYRAVGDAFVERSGLDPAGGEVVQVIRADLDGDGIEEVLVTFERIHDDMSTPGDFSIVYARYPSPDGTVDDDLLVEYYPQVSDDRPAVGSAAVLAVADLNGDAVMEVVLTSRFWEAHLVSLWAWEDGRLAMVADGGCSL